MFYLDCWKTFVLNHVRLLSVFSLPPKKWSGPPRPSPWCRCSSSSRPSSSATSDTSGRSAPSSPSSQGSSSYCQVLRTRAPRANRQRRARVHLHPPARRVVLINFFSVLRNKSKTHRTQITLLWNNSCLQAFSCHGLFPYFPITPPRVVVAAKQPGRQNLSCGENLWNEKSVENKHVFQEDKTASRSEFYAKKVQLMGQVLLPASSTFSPPLSEVYEPVIKSGLSSAALRSLVLPRFKLKALQFGTVTMRDSKLVLLRQIKKKRNLKNSAAAEI